MGRVKWTRNMFLSTTLRRPIWRQLRLSLKAKTILKLMCEMDLRACAVFLASWIFCKDCDCFGGRQKGYKLDDFF